MNNELKVGDRVYLKREGKDYTGTVVAILPYDCWYPGNRLLIQDDPGKSAKYDGGISVRGLDGKWLDKLNPDESLDWVKLPKAVTVYHMLYKTPDSPKLRMLAFLSKNMYEQNLKSLAGAAGYIVVKTWSEEVEIPE